ncbi:MAG: cupin domain-containing protein [Candidatus Lokiarchaeota archaeon]|nr:cupin domain-containing protein [Candidatus Lokiarchaeota archaeon]
MLGKAKDLSALVDYQRNSVVSKMLLTKGAGNVTLFAFDGQGLSEHSAPFDALVQGIDGEGTVRIEGVDSKVGRGQVIVMPANKPHAVLVPAGTRFKMMLVMIKA